ncbi:TIGR01777 family oxidoreductase [Desulfopila aestuarii]|uniref:TIGR01777 family protein n=1 Tax=Desulfopila aestuarii DSM 18488 TaxID=1121416 RepID=A0A1M7YDJ2_9BACT|nr:TIGR01777 family oxidoreductase [Desulfopila aestuarii]SHO50646.1 hypothetical protein SAMN02745220_03563 [Desulfopila aestuarii DSM 18488]
MRTLITGASGLIGSALLESLHAKGHAIRCLQRNKKNSASTIWNTDVFAQQENEDNFDTIIHLAGENVADGRWNESRKKRIMESRIKGTRELIELLGKLSNPPATFICASAIGYYGNRGSELLTEESEAGKGFLAEVCKKWEVEAQKAQEIGCRVVNLRFGMVLSPGGGALHKMLPPFKAGLGGPIGNGKQYMSWVSIRDLVEIVDFAINDDSLNGPVNVVSPVPVTNREFTRCLAGVLGRPALLPVPPFALRLMFGEMADEMLLAGSRVKPEKLISSGYSFQDVNLSETLRFCTS